MDNFFVNGDITREILSHLPVRILLKFRSMCKSWRDSIDSSFFRNLHVQNQLLRSGNIDDDEIVFLQFMPPRGDKHPNREVFKTVIMDFPSYTDFLIDHIQIHFSGVVHGLICLFRDCPGNPIGLCNPILQEIKILPDSPPFPNACCDHNVGLGYDHDEQDFKVVQLITPLFPEESIVVRVYSRKQNKWREVGDHPLHRDIMILWPILSSSSSGAFAHWNATDYSEEATTNSEFSRDIVVSFDMRREAFKTIRIPARFGNAGERHEILATEDSLIVFVLPNTINRDEVVSMWEYKLSAGGQSKREDWIQIGSLGPFNGRVEPIMWWKSEGLVLKISSNGCVEFLFYDCRTRQIVTSIPNRVHLQYNRPTFISPYN